MNQTVYSEEDAQQILQRAMTIKAEKDALLSQKPQELTPEQLMAMAAELGLDEETLLQARRTLEMEQAQQKVQQQIRAQRLQGWRYHALIFSVANAILFVNGAFGNPCLIFLPFAWGFGLIGHGLAAYRQNSPEI